MDDNELYIISLDARGFSIFLQVRGTGDCDNDNIKVKMIFIALSVN